MTSLCERRLAPHDKKEQCLLTDQLELKAKKGAARRLNAVVRVGQLWFMELDSVLSTEIRRELRSSVVLVAAKTVITWTQRKSRSRRRRLPKRSRIY